MQAILILAHKDVKSVIELSRKLQTCFEIYIHFDTKLSLSSEDKKVLDCLLYTSRKRENSLKTRFGMPKEWFQDLTEYEFEGKKLLGTRDYDTILRYIYNDYMKLPPEDQRDPHAPVSSYHF